MKDTKPVKPVVTELKCSRCGQTVSGPDSKAVKATLARHTAKAH